HYHFQHLSLFQDNSHHLSLPNNPLHTLKRYHFMIKNYLINLLISLNLGCSAVSINSKSAISTEVTAAPSDFIFSRPTFLLSLVLEDTPSTTTSTYFPSSNNSLTVWYTQIWVSIPATRKEFFPSFFSSSWKFSFLHALNVILSIGLFAVKCCLISSAVGPRPFGYCSSQRIGISRILAPLINFSKFASSSLL